MYPAAPNPASGGEYLATEVASRPRAKYNPLADPNDFADFRRRLSKPRPRVRRGGEAPEPVGRPPGASRPRGTAAHFSLEGRLMKAVRFVAAAALAVLAI